MAAISSGARAAGFDWNDLDRKRKLLVILMMPGWLMTDFFLDDRLYALKTKSRKIIPNVSRSMILI